MPMRTLYKYDPPSMNANNKPFYVLNDGDHIYVLDNDLKVLQQKMEFEDENEKAKPLQVSHNCYINMDPKPVF